MAEVDWDEVFFIDIIIAIIFCAFVVQKTLALQSDTVRTRKLRNRKTTLK